MEIDRNGLEVLGREECTRLLAASPVGRLALHVRALPTILPVNHLVTPWGIVIRTRPGTKLDAAVMNAVVAFEVDRFDSLTHTGWSVVVTGVASELTDPQALEHVRRLPLPHWAPGDADHYVVISLELIDGRRIVHTPEAHPVDAVS